MLAVLGRFPGLSAIEVGERIAIHKVAVSRAIASLLKNARVTRELDPRDRLRSILNLDAVGQRIYAQVAPLALEQEQRRLSVLSAAECAALNTILNKLATLGVAALHQQTQMHDVVGASEAHQPA